MTKAAGVGVHMRLSLSFIGSTRHTAILKVGIKAVGHRAFIRPSCAIGP